MAKEQQLDPGSIQRLVAQELRKTKQTPGIYAYKPWSRQKEFHLSKAHGKIFMGGNRAGKTVSGAAETVMRLIGEHPYNDTIERPPIRARGIGVDFDRGINLIMIPELKKWIPSKFLKNGSWEQSYNKSERILTLTNGSTMEFMSYEQDRDKFQGTSRHWCWFDEEPPQSIFNECMLRLVDVDGSWCMTMTPLIEMSWSYDQLYEPGMAGELESIDIFTADTEENPHINQDALRRQMQTLSEEEKKTRSKGTYISHTGLVYGEVFTREKNVIPDIVNSSRFDILVEKWSHFQMMDHGFNNPTVFLFAAYDRDGRIVIYDEIYQNKTIVKEFAKLVKRRRKALGITTEYVVGDPAIRAKDAIKGSSVQAEYGENGIYIALGNNDVHNGISRVQQMFMEQQLLISERCKETLKEIRKYRWDRHLTKLGDRKNNKEEPVKKDDHAMDAMRYGIMSRPKQYDKKIDDDEKVTLPSSYVASDYDWDMVHKTDKIIDEHLGTEF